MAGDLMGRMAARGAIELKDIQLETRIGTFGPGDVMPDAHLLDMTLWIDPALILIADDGMAHVFDYDPLIAEIDRLGRDGAYETQERLASRIVQACAENPAITALEITLRTTPGPSGSGSVGVRLVMDADAINDSR